MKINPFSENNPMTWVDAAKISTVLMAGSFFIEFLFGWSVERISSDPPAFIFEMGRNLGAEWFKSFMVLTGLRAYVKRKHRE